MRHHRSAFSLVELLCVIAIVGVLAAVAVPVVRHLGADNMQSIHVKAQGVMEQARQFAQAHRTFVRMGFAQVDGPGGIPQVAVQCLSSATGDLRHDTSPDFADESLWRTIGRPVILSGVVLDDSLRARLPADASISTPGTGFPSFSRRVDGRPLSFQKVIQFDPLGQISVAPGTLARTTMVGLSNPSQQANPVVVVMSGLSGSVRVLRQENLNP